MQEYMKTILSALKAWVNKRIKNNTPDWDQSDPNTDGYIKNKPFYNNVDYVTINSKIISI